MTPKKQLVLSLSLAALVLVGGIGAGLLLSRPSKTAAVSVRFPIPIVESGQSPFYLAEDEGYYAKEGLSIKFNMGSRELNPVKMVASGQDDFGVLGGPDTLLVARSKGAPLVAVAVLHRNSNFSCLLTLASSGITTVQQLQGKKVGFFYGHISTDVLRALFRKEHVSVKEVDVGFDYSQLIAGQIAAEWAFTVTAGLDLPARGVKVNVISPATYGIVTQGYTIFAREDFIQKHPDIVLHFLRATLHGVRDAVAHPKQANAALLRRDPNLNAALSLRRQMAYNAVTSDSAQYPAGYMDTEMFQSTYDRLAKEGEITHPFTVSSAFTTKFLDEIYGRAIGH